MTQNNPLNLILEAQRNLLEQSQQTFQNLSDESSAMQKQALEALTKQLSNGESSQRTTKMVKDAVETYFDNLESYLQESEEGLQDAREVVLDQFDEIEDLQTDILDALQVEVDQLVEGYNGLTEQWIGVFNRSLESYLAAEEEFAESAQEIVDTVEESFEETVELETIDGIGPSYAEKLRAAGIEDTTDLASCSPEEIAGMINAGLVNEDKARNWIEDAS